MPKVKIEVYEDGAPSATISVPAWVVTGGASLLPKVAGQRLENCIDPAQLAEMLRDPKVSGKLIEVEDHTAGDRLVVSLVGDDEAG